jgi:hypothetical protein
MNELMLLRIAELLADAGAAPDAPVTVGGGAFRFVTDAILDGVVDGVDKGGRRRINEGGGAMRAETMVTALTQSGCCHDSFPIATVVCTRGVGCRRTTRDRALQSTKVTDHQRLECHQYEDV